MRSEQLFESIPSNWEFAPIKHLCTKQGIYGANVSADCYVNNGVRFIRTSDILDNGFLAQEGVYLPLEIVLEYLLEPGDFIISRSGTVGRAFVYESKWGACAYAGYLVRFVFDHNQNPRFYFYLTKSSAFTEWINKSAIEATIGNVNAQKYSNLITPVPPLQEQNTIVAYLDCETARLDTLTATLEHLLALLAEKRWTLIMRAVTRGLEPDVPLRDSGVEWLGEIPRHWQIARLKSLCDSLQTGPFGSQLHAEEYIDHGIPVINPAHLVDNKIVPDYSVSVNEWMADYLSMHKLEVGDIVFARRGEIGRCGLVTEKEAGWLCGTGSLRARPNKEIINPEYLIWLITNSFASTWLSLMAVGTTMSNLNTAIVGDLPLPVPPLTEQNRIVAFINQNITHLDGLQIALGKMNDLLYERRAALITAAVSGKIDLRREECKSVD